MTVETLFIVGDKFEHFANNQHVTTISRLESHLTVHARHGRPLQLQLGQGLSEDQLELIQETTQRLNRPWLAAFPKPSKAGRRHVHKHQAHNSMIGMPKRVGRDSFSVDVLLDERCAEMSDHVTGQHIQGMVLTEATRQTFLAVTEEFYLGEQPTSSYFVINNMDVEYLRFVFPLPMSIQYQVLEHSISERSGTQRFSVCMEVIQAEQICCRVNTRFATYPDAVIAEKESALAAQAVEQELAREVPHDKLA